MTAPLLTVLNFSGGKQSTALLWMVLRGDLAPAEGSRLLVVNADPGMEDSRTYRHVAEMGRLCGEAGIEFATAEGPNLYEDLIGLAASGRTRIDNPPYYTAPQKVKKAGRVGRLQQGCTKYYKVAPMDRVVRRVLHREFGINPKAGNIGEDIVEKWIGFHAGEWHRCSESAQRYVRFRYPLIELGMDDAAVAGYYLSRGLPVPPRSVCNACFANGLAHFKDMHDNRPDDWAQAVAVDDSVRDWSQVGVTEEVFVSKSLVPLREMAARGFDLGEDDPGEECNDGGYCFV